MRIIVFFVCFISLYSYANYPKRKGTIPKTASGEFCPVNDNATFADFPGTKDDDPSVSRNQDTVGYCRNFATTDMVCHALKAIKNKDGKSLWPYDSKCSVSDMVLQYYKYLHKEKRLTGAMTISDFLKNLTVDDAFLDKFSHEIGYCPESSFPSEFINNAGLGNFKNHYDAASQKLTEAQVSLPGYCKECTEMAPILSQSQWDLVNKVAQNDRSPEGAFKTLDKMNELSCPANKRIKLPEGYFTESIGFKFTKDAPLTPNIFTQTLYYGNPVEISVWADKIHPGDPKNYPHKEHSVLVAGAYIDDADKECHYVIKNSWALDCRNIKDTFDLKCDPVTGVLHATWKGMMEITSRATPTYIASSKWKEKNEEGK